MTRQSEGTRPRGQGGQALVVLTLAMVALLAMSSLIVDGGNAFAQQRVTQNGADAAAQAGAVVLVQNLIAKGSGATPPNSDQDVLESITTTASWNDIKAAPTAVYTDIGGNSLGTKVGSIGGGLPPSNAYGVQATAGRAFTTFLGGVFSLLPGGQGVFQLTASATATAIAGQVNGICPADVPCGFLPVTFPTLLTLCDGSNKQVGQGTGWPYQTAQLPLNGANEVILPLCTTGPGSVGWLDIEPHDPSCTGGGTQLLACDISTPGNKALDLPVWVHTVTGNTNSVQVQDALNAFEGKTVQIPFYDCVKNDVGQVHPGPVCPTPPETATGNNLYYRITSTVNFVLDHAYIQGNNPECNLPPGHEPVGGNGATGCIKGWFVNALNPGPIGLPSGSTPWAAYGVQLIK